MNSLTQFFTGVKAGMREAFADVRNLLPAIFRNPYDTGEAVGWFIVGLLFGLLFLSCVALVIALII